MSAVGLEALLSFSRKRPPARERGESESQRGSPGRSSRQKHLAVLDRTALRLLCGETRSVGRPPWPADSALQFTSLARALSPSPSPHPNRCRFS